MAGSLTLALRTAQSGLLANQEALNAVANNISNVNTPGYSRKVVNMEQRVVSGVGSGVQVGEVVRKVDEGLLKSMRNEFGTLNAFDARSPYYQRLQEIFGKPEDNTSIGHTLTEFTTAIETLSVNPANTLEQSEVMRKGKDVADQLQRMNDTIQELRVQADRDITEATTRITQLLDSIGTLNNKLIANKAVSADVTDLRDQRDQALDQLSGLIDISYYYRDDGDAVVFTKAGRTLVDNSTATISHDQASALSPTSTHAEGDIGGIYIGAQISTNDITNEIRNGTLRGLLDMRDDVLTNLQSQIDELSGQVRDAINQAHNAGSPFPGLQTMNGTRTFIDGDNQSITFGGTTDTTIALMDGSGNQTAVTTIRTLVGGATTTINNLASSVQTWLQANGVTGATVALNSTGKLDISLNTTTANLVFRDQTATADGSTASDASIQFNANGAAAGTFEETVSGFSNFFGLNDFYIDSLPDDIHDTNILSSTYTLPSNTTLTFYNAANSPAGAGMGSVALTAGQSLDQIIAAVNNAGIGLTASKVPDGDGFRLRFSEDNGTDMVVVADNTFATDTGLDISNVRASQRLKVRDDIVSTPGNLSRGALQWDSDKGAAGEYIMSASDNATVEALATRMSQSTQFSKAGGLTALNVSVVSYSISI
ncbi:MAG: flagellar hook-associated protein FlgK, partial [Magnetovibrio sp.]|nr:flagellar hook-associated protein FlgK [Magnetovibrio sp.]